MNKISTSEMVYRLKDGEVAWTQYGDFKKYVKKNCDGVFYCDAEGKYTHHLNQLIPLSLWGNVINAEWTILPKHESFKDATKAIKNGQVVKLYHECSYVEIGESSDLEDISIESGGGLTFGDLLNGKYVIEGKS